MQSGHTIKSGFLIITENREIRHDDIFFKFSSLLSLLVLLFISAICRFYYKRKAMKNMVPYSEIRRMSLIYVANIFTQQKGGLVC